MWLLQDELIGNTQLRVTSAIKTRSTRTLFRGTFTFDLRFEDSPESESLVCCCTGYCGTVRAQRKMKDTASMTSKLSHLLQFWVFPDAQLVIDVTMRGENFFFKRVPLECANLTVCRD